MLCAAFSPNCLSVFVQHKELISHGVCNCMWSSALEWRECGEEHERERRGPLRVLSGSPERRIMVLGCGLWGSVFPGLITLLPTVPGGTKNGTGQNRPSPLLSHYVHHRSHRSLFSVSHLFSLQRLIPFSIFLLTAFLSLSSSLICCFFPPSPPLPGSLTKHTLVCVHTNTRSSSFDHQAGSALIWINWQRF